MKIDYKITDEKLKYNINRETANLSTLKSVTIDKCKYLTGKEILTSDQSKMIINMIQESLTHLLSQKNYLVNWYIFHLQFFFKKNVYFRIFIHSNMVY